MKRLLFVGFVVVVCCAISTSTLHASVLNTLVPGVPNILDDQDYESLVKNEQNGQNTIVEVGDYLVSMVAMQQRIDVSGSQPNHTYDDPSNNFTSVAIIEVATKSINVDGTLASYTFRPAPQTVWAQVSNNNPNLAPQSADTLAMVFDDPGPSPYIDQFVTDVPQNPYANALATAADGAALWEFGLVGASAGSQDPNLFWDAQTTASSGAADDILALNSLGFWAQLDVTHAYAASSLWSLAKHSTAQSGALNNPVVSQNFLGFGPAQLQIAGSGGSDFDLPGVFQITTDSDFVIVPVPVPEPASVLAWIGLMAMGLGLVIRRRK